MPSGHPRSHLHISPSLLALTLWCAETPPPSTPSSHFPLFSGCFLLLSPWKLFCMTLSLICAFLLSCSMWLHFFNASVFVCLSHLQASPTYVPLIYRYAIYVNSVTNCDVLFSNVSTPQALLRVQSPSNSVLGHQCAPFTCASTQSSQSKPYFPNHFFSF